MHKLLMVIRREYLERVRKRSFWLGTMLLPLLGVGLILAALIWPLIKAIARRIEGGAASTELQTELEGLRKRVRQLEEMQPRMLELEERVDFTERVVAKSREPARLERQEG